MTEKDTALARRAQLQAELAAIEKIIAAPDAVSLLGDGKGTSFSIMTDGLHRIGVAKQSDGVLSSLSRSRGNRFPNAALASKYAEAFSTFLLLRQQPNSVAASSQTQYQIDVSNDGKSLTAAMVGPMIGVKLSNLSPCFTTKEAAQAAIDTVGASRILAMYRTFQHAPEAPDGAPL